MNFPTTFFGWVAFLAEKYGPDFMRGLGVTLQLATIGTVLGCVLGFVVGMVRSVDIDKHSSVVSQTILRILKAIIAVYVEVIRGTPILLQLYFFYFMLPQWFPALDLSEFTCVMIACCVNSTAYVCEIVRAGIQAVDAGQTEAARSLGLNSRQAMIHIVLPQAVKNILPALCNEFVAIVKETSLASTFFIGELMTQFKTINGITFRVLEPLTIVGIIYFLVTFVMSKLIALLERRMNASER